VTIFTGAALLACRGHETKVPRPSYVSPPDSSDIDALRTLALRHSCGITPDFWGVRQIHGSDLASYLQIEERELDAHEGRFFTIEVTRGPISELRPQIAERQTRAVWMNPAADPRSKPAQ
jgi:hypothetical protein